MQEYKALFPLLADVKLTKEADTKTIARLFALLLVPGDIIALWGDLGVGKSTLARSVIQNLCGADTDVPSPTFTLVQTYETAGFDLWHMDLYRQDTPEDVFELGVDDAFHDGVCLIEWPDKLGAYLPLNRLDAVMRFDTGENTRSLELRGDTTWAARLKDVKI